jgi:uncharacterized membrane protein (UPF0127 family)
MCASPVFPLTSLKFSAPFPTKPYPVKYPISLLKFATHQARFLPAPSSRRSRAAQRRIRLKSPILHAPHHFPAYAPLHVVTCLPILHSVFKICSPTPFRSQVSAIRFSPPSNPVPSNFAPSEISNFKSLISRFCHATRHSLLLPLLTLTLLSPAQALTGPQPTLPTITLRLGTTTLQAEVADTPETRAIGLMGRTELADGQAMLFVFTQPQPMSFWMHNTLIPLSIAYINAAGVIREIHDMQPLDKTMIRSAFRDHLYALEVPQGWFQKNKILPGDKIHGLPAPSTAQPD